MTPGVIHHKYTEDEALMHTDLDLGEVLIEGYSLIR
jgi:hypothetical protein